MRGWDEWMHTGKSVRRKMKRDTWQEAERRRRVSEKREEEEVRQDEGRTEGRRMSVRETGPLGRTTDENR